MVVSLACSIHAQLSTILVRAARAYAQPRSRTVRSNCRPATDRGQPQARARRQDVSGYGPH